MTVSVAGACASLMKFVLADNAMEDGGNTVTLVVTSANPGDVARITVVPTAIAVSLNPITWPVAAIVTEGPTMATDGFEEVNVKVVAAWAGPESDNVSVASAPGPRRLTFEGVSVADVPIVTKVDAALSPVDDALMVAVPMPMPLITTERLGVV